MKNNGFLVTVMIFVSIVFILSGCFTDWAGEGSITIGAPSQSTAGVARSLVTDNEAALYIRYDYTLNGPGGSINGSVSGTQTAVVTVIPGNWEITVKAYGKKHGDQTETDIVLRGMGSTNVVVKSGRNENAIVKMVTTTEITNWDDFVEAVEGSPYNGREEIIIIKNNLTVTSTVMIDRKITILTDDVPVTIRRDPYYDGGFFDIHTNAYLVLGKKGSAAGMLVFDGNDGNMDSSVQVNKAIIYMAYGGGTVVMNDGVKITRNNHDYTYGGMSGGGVEMANGTFIMNGGEITSNKAGNGGGVYINSSAGSTITFTMNGGSIINNTVTSGGGGVYMYGGYGTETFTINNGGIISGNSASGDGAGLYIGNGAIFNNNGGTINNVIYYEP